MKRLDFLKALSAVPLFGGIAKAATPTETVEQVLNKHGFVKMWESWGRTCYHKFVDNYDGSNDPVTGMTYTHQIFVRKEGMNIHKGYGFYSTMMFSGKVENAKEMETLFKMLEL